MGRQMNNTIDDHSAGQRRAGSTGKAIEGCTSGSTRRSHAPKPPPGPAPPSFSASVNIKCRMQGRRPGPGRPGAARNCAPGRLVSSRPRPQPLRSPGHASTHAHGGRHRARHRHRQAPTLRLLTADLLPALSPLSRPCRPASAGTATLRARQTCWRCARAGGWEQGARPRRRRAAAHRREPTGQTAGWPFNAHLTFHTPTPSPREIP